MGEAQTLRVSVRVPIRDLEERAVLREICGLQVPERPLRASRKWLPAGCAQVAGACFAGLPGNPSKQLSIPDLCASYGVPLTPLPPPCACVYSSPSRRTPADAAARTPRTGYCGRRRRSDRPFRTGLQRWLEKEEIPSQAPVFHEFLESIFSNLRSPYLDGEFDPGSGRTLAARLTHASRAVKAPSGVHKAANGRVTRGQPAPLPGIAGGNPG